MARGKNLCYKNGSLYDFFWNEETSKYERGAMDTDAEAIYKYILIRQASIDVVSF